LAASRINEVLSGEAVLLDGRIAEIEVVCMDCAKLSECRLTRATGLPAPSAPTFVGATVGIVATAMADFVPTVIRTACARFARIAHVVAAGAFIDDANPVLADAPIARVGIVVGEDAPAQ
jgi:hypothetical protein